jgi:hypothetical protein
MAATRAHGTLVEAHACSSCAQDSGGISNNGRGPRTERVVVQQDLGILLPLSLARPAGGKAHVPPCAPVVPHTVEDIAPNSGAHGSAPCSPTPCWATARWPSL